MTALSASGIGRGRGISQQWSMGGHTYTQTHIKCGEEAGVVSCRAGTPSKGGSGAGGAHSVLDVQNF